MNAKHSLYWCMPLALALAFGSMVASGCELIATNDLSLVDGGSDDGGCPICLVDGMVITDEAGDPVIVPLDAGSSPDAADAKDASPDARASDAGTSDGGAH